MISVKNLSKSFGQKLAVDDISFEVKKGEVLGFLGPNGAGKSTTMRMVTGYLPPTSGEVVIDGINIAENSIGAKQKIGYLPEAAPLYSDMTVSSFLNFIAELRGKSKSDVEAAIDTCFLGPVRQQSIETLSKGYKHRTCLAQSILHDPEILVLDEPTDGLDPNQKQEVRNLIKRMGEDKAIIFSTHILEEVEAACTRAIIIDQGRVVADGAPNDLKAKASGSGSHMVKISGMAGSGIRSELSSISGVEMVREFASSESSFSGQVLPSKKVNTNAESIFNLCKEKGLLLEELRVEEGRLDEVFREITKTDTEISERIVKEEDPEKVVQD
ncbi:MAG: ATP-binding cassette domain-containing protein [Verrucomicrobiales bacterium]|nr:ATP-binding cassette domain-containing protein [Verrucomicrobiales bacterium]